MRRNRIFRTVPLTIAGHWSAFCPPRLGKWAVTARPHRRQRRREIVGSSVAAADGRGEFNCRATQWRGYKIGVRKAPPEFRTTGKSGMMEYWNGGQGARGQRASDGSAARIWFPPEADSKKQGKLGPDGGAPREAQYSCMRKRGKPADGPRSPPHFLNQIRDASLHANNPLPRPAAYGASHSNVRLDKQRGTQCRRTVSRKSRANPG